MYNKRYMDMVNSDGLKLKEIPSNFKTEDICLAAVKQNGMALKFIYPAYHTKKIIDAAVSNNIKSIQYTDKYDENYAMSLVMKDPSILNMTKYKNNPKFILAVKNLKEEKELKEKAKASFDRTELKEIYEFFTFKNKMLSRTFRDYIHNENMFKEMLNSKLIELFTFENLIYFINVGKVSIMEIPNEDSRLSKKLELNLDYNINLNDLVSIVEESLEYDSLGLAFENLESAILKNKQ